MDSMEKNTSDFFFTVFMVISVVILKQQMIKNKIVNGYCVGRFDSIGCDF